MKRVIYKRFGLLGPPKSHKPCSDIDYKIDLRGFDLKLEVFKLSGLSQHAIYLDGERIIEHRSGIPPPRKGDSFSEKYFSIYGTDKIFFKGYEAAENFGEIVKLMSEKEDKYGGLLISLNDEVVMRIFLGGDFASSLRFMFAKRSEKSSLMTDLGFEYSVNIDPILAVCIFLFSLNGLESN